MKIHLDTDIGGDMDDLCALAMLLACAIALGWNEGVEMETVSLKLEMRDSWLYEIPDSNGTPTRLVTKIDGNAFNEFWLDMLCSS
jgi:hypothetical protein